MARSVRTHWMFAILMSFGIVLRVLAQLAYRPALLFPDSSGYLADAVVLHPSPERPYGYSLLLAILPTRHHLAVIPAVQHVFALGMAAGIYLVTLHFVRRRWAAALAAAPVLLDAYQVDIEQYVLSDTLFEVLLLAACIALLVGRRRRPRVAVALALLAGALTGAAAVTRTPGVFVIAPVAVAALLAGTRAAPKQAVAGALAAVIGFGAIYGSYVVWFHDYYGAYSTSTLTGRFMYARVAPFADCSKFTVPTYEQPLCQQPPPSLRDWTVGQYMWSRFSPVDNVTPPPGKTRDAVLGDFARRVIRAQPGAYTRSVLTEFLKGFRPTRADGPQDETVVDWQFRPSMRFRLSPYYRVYQQPFVVNDHLVAILGGYQRFGYVPGPLLALGALAPLLLLGLRRRRIPAGMFLPTAVFAGVGVAAVLGADIGAGFIWRYQLPQLVLLPPAAVIAWVALLDSRARVTVPAPSVEAASETEDAGCFRGAELREPTERGADLGVA